MIVVIVVFIKVKMELVVLKGVCVVKVIVVILVFF